jgi:hypothetical protein
MKKKRFAAEQIVAILKQAELGIPIAELIHQRKRVQPPLSGLVVCTALIASNRQ